MDIRELREKHGVSLGEIARMTGVPRPSVQAIENGQYRAPDNEARIKTAIPLIGALKKRHEGEWKRLARELQQSKSRKR
ncbi:MAG: helix-turn-helix transcriptional regulator [Acidobacteria bacterium]|nr:helix-turn-helix transcriptional regulator [Acidobacteriota bacterium]